MANQTWHSLDEAGRKRWRQERKRRDYEAMRGNPRMVSLDKAERVRAKVRIYRARGMNLAQMQRQTGVHQSTISEQLRPMRTGMNRRTYLGLIQMTFEEPSPTSQVDATGTRRRILSLWHDGFGPQFQSDRTGWPKSNVQRIARGKTLRVEYRTVRMFQELYEKLEDSQPAEFGIPERSVRYVRTFARKLGGVSRGCWDEDTIDDPEAIPDWTGYCGTGLGMAVHRRDGIPPCEPCEKAFTRGVPYPGFNGERLKELRLRAGYARVPLAKLAHLHESSIQYWETGRSIPQRMGGLDRVLSVLDATYDDVCDQGEEA